MIYCCGVQRGATKRVLKKYVVCVSVHMQNSKNEKEIIMITVENGIITINPGLFGLNGVSSLRWSVNEYNTTIVRVITQIGSVSDARHKKIE